MSRLSRLLLALPLLTVVASPAWAQPAPAQPAGPQTQTEIEGPGTTPAQPQQPERPQLSLHPSLGGPIGLWNNFTAEVGPQWTFRFAIHGEIFRSSDFLVVGDQNTRFAGSIQIGFTPLKFLELWFSSYSTSNDNQRVDPTRQDPEVILALGDFAFGAKTAFKFGRIFGAGLNLGVKFLNSVGGLTPSGDATGVDIRALGMIDLTQLNRPLPLRFHLNVGWILDNSAKLVSIDQRLAAGISPTQAFVEQYAYGIQPSRVHFGLGIEAPFWLGPVGLNPILEYTLGAATGGESQAVLGLPDLRGVNNVEGKVSQKLTIGLRVRPIRNYGLAVEVASDVGLTSYGFAVGPPTPPYNIILGLSYAFDPRPVVKLITKEVPKPVAAAPVTGTIRGTVKDARTQAPLRDALVGFQGRNVNDIATREDGGFDSYPFPPGEIDVEVRKEGYKPAMARVRVVEGRATKIDVLLAPATPPFGTVSGRVVDDGGKPVSGVKVVFEGPKAESLDLNNGEFSDVKLPPGEYVVKFSATGYLVKNRPLSVRAGEKYSLDVTLRKQPKRATARLTKKQIIINRQVSFRTNEAEILPESFFILDEVAHILLTNPQITKVLVEGHTDNTGTDRINQKLSQDRAESVKAYLVQAGVSSDRLNAEGFGATKPLVPNITARNKARNRRVVFTIVDQTK
jgi:outer membrane protein OmpA-like peptidoglycan-associated protein